MTRKQLQPLLLHTHLVILGLLVGMSEGQAQPNLQGLTFKDALDSCIKAVSSGDLGTAADLFQSLETTFGSEQEYRLDEAQSRILPLKGLAELGAGRHAKAAQTLESLQELFPQILQSNASLVYGLAQAYRGSGNLEKAREMLALYVSQFPGTAEASLAFLERADLFFQDGLIDEGLAALDQFNNSEAPYSLKMQGQLKAVQACLDNGRMPEATQRMQNTSWSVTSMPELAQLTFSALRCGEFAMSQADYGSALRLFHLVPPKSQLLRMQKEKLNDLETHILSGRQRAMLSTNRHQQAYLSNLRQKLSQQLQALENSDDYTPTFYLHYGQSLLFDAQFYKAWLVFEYLSLKNDYPQEVREEAHYRWVVCAHQLADWEEALTIARNFVDRYPKSKLAPQALYLIAKAHLEQRRYPESIEVLSDLISGFPEHPLFGRWLFTRGFNHVVLEAYDLARIDFQSYSTTYPNGQLLINARLWNALTFFFERNYPVCIEQLIQLQEVDSRHPLYPEVLYRLASAYYSSRDYDSALRTIGDYLERFSRHQRIDEARVLKGDILMGQGELDEAIVSFRGVAAESPDLFLYSLFQIGKILRAQENYNEMATHFQRFLEGTEFPRLRVSEALYWLGWSFQQLDRIDLAYPVFEEALRDYGDDIAAAETQSILQALETLKKRQGAEDSGHENSLIRSKDFKTWLINEIARAEKEKMLTYLSRLVLYFQNRYPEERGEGHTILSLADTVPMELLDPEALGKVGLALLDEADNRANPYFSHLVDSFPRSNARAMGYLGLARIAEESGDFDSAKEWLSKSTKQVPSHEHMHESQLLMGAVLTELEEYDPSIETYEKLLRLKSARGRPHAAALSGIARAYKNQGDSTKAIAYYQRIYNMYRAYPDFVASAYLSSARLFESLDRIPEAVNTLREMLNQKHLAEYPEWAEAEKKLPSLLPLMLEEEETTAALEPIKLNEQE